MHLSLYTLTSNETEINYRYQSFGIHHASDMDIHYIANCFNGEISTTKYNSHVIWDDVHNFFVIFLNQYLSEKERRYQFFHELAHPLLHVDQQTNEMPDIFTQYQEEQAQHFQLYAALPFYMLKEYEHVPASCLIKVLSEEFILPNRLIQQRLEQVKNRINNEVLSARLKREYKAYEERLYPKADSNNWSKETMDILDKLNRNLSKRGAAVTNG